MKYRLNFGIIFILYVIFAFISCWSIEHYISNLNLKNVALGCFAIITGVWGNIARTVFLRIPAGPKSYKIINYLIIAFGIIFVISGSYKYYFK